MGRGLAEVVLLLVILVVAFFVIPPITMGVHKRLARKADKDN